MNSKYNASMSFKFENGGNEYIYDSVKCEVSGSKIRDSIKYCRESVNGYLRNGQWKVIGELIEFPRAGVYAKLDCNAKVYIVGESSKQGTWVVETQGFSMLTMRTNQLKTLVDDDNRAYAIVDDLKISFHQAMQMVKKGYGKL